MFLSKLQQSYSYTRLCNFSEAFVFKLVSNQFNIRVDYNLSFTVSLNAFYHEMDR